MKKIFIKKIFLALIATTAHSALLSGFGSGDSQSLPADSVNASSPVTDISFVSDTYGLQFPTFLYASDNAMGLVLRAEIVSSEQEMWFDTNVFRIDCPDGVTPGTYDMAEVDSLCTFLIFNGFPSTRFETVGGSLEVDEAGEWFAGTFEVLFADNYYSDSHLHRLSGSFSAPVGYGESPTLPFPSAPANAEALFVENCQGCHNLVELSRAGCLLPEIIGGDTQHDPILLTPEETYSLKVLLNSTFS